MSLNAFVTLVTSDSYVAGALVSIHSVLEAEGPNPANAFETVCLVTPSTVSVQSIKSLRQNFSLVVGVEVLASANHDNLRLLGRQDLASTLTKLHLWRLIQFRKVIFLDADTLCLQPLSHLFSLQAPFSAAPDSGWPDCFNSGMFVATPSAETFDKLVELTKEKGSWDGGDQGLLNDFFHDWNRLSFTYNVTPTAYYTYAPAYRRYGGGIKLVHFIGSHKPWHEPGPSRQVPSTSENGGASDYASLLNKWFAVYQRNISPSQSQATFSFPKLQATWDAPGGPTPYLPPSLEDLKRQFQGVKASQQNQTLQGNFGSIEGHYVSMPLAPGRPDLTQTVVLKKPEPVLAPSEAVMNITSASPPQNARPLSPPPSLSAPPPMPVSVTVQAPSPRADSPPHWSPPNVSWDPARSEPPKNDRPQMEAGFDQQYSNVWDQRGKNVRQFFSAPQSYGGIPRVTHHNYGQSTGHHSPDQSKVKPIFPWEEQASQASRVFPDEHRPRPPPASAQAGHHQHASMPMSPPPQGQPSALAAHYSNAWDAIPAIRRYAEAREKPQKHKHLSHHHHHQEQAQSHQRRGSYQSSNASSRRDRDGRRTKSSNEAYDAGDQSSRDGDNEDDDEEGSGAEGEPLPRKSPPKSFGSRRNGNGNGKSSGSTAMTSAGAHSTKGADRGHSPQPGRSNLPPTKRSDSYQNMVNLAQNAVAASGFSEAAAAPRRSKLSGSRSSSSETVTPTGFTPVLPDPSDGAYRSQRVSRVFHSSTDTDHIKNAGLDALHRFVRNMEAKGAEATAQQNQAQTSRQPVRPAPPIPSDANRHRGGHGHRGGSLGGSA